MKPTAKQISQVRDFINSQIAPAKAERFDERVGIYFLAIELISLAVAIVQIENRALNFNMGLVIFIIGGVLSFLYEIAKRLQSIQYRLAVYKMFKIYIISLIAALLAMLPLFLWLMASSEIFATQELGIFDIFVFLMIFVPTVYLIQKYTKNHHHIWLESFEIARKQKYFQTNREKAKRDLLIKMTDVAVPQGYETIAIVHVLNLLLVLSTLDNQPVYEGFLSTILVQPVIWSFVLVLMMILPVLYYRASRSEPVNLLNTYLNEEEFSQEGIL